MRKTSRVCKNSIFTYSESSSANSNSSSSGSESDISISKSEEKKSDVFSFFFGFFVCHFVSGVISHKLKKKNVASSFTVGCRLGALN
jgi:hypothetical protein